MNNSITTIINNNITVYKQAEGNIAHSVFYYTLSRCGTRYGGLVVCTIHKADYRIAMDVYPEKIYIEGWIADGGRYQYSVDIDKIVAEGFLTEDEGQMLYNDIYDFTISDKEYLCNGEGPDSFTKTNYETPAKQVPASAEQVSRPERQRVQVVYEDNVNAPAHYKTGGIETIDFIEAKQLGYHLANAVKYISRAGKKDETKTVEDLKKAVWYINRYITVLEKGIEI